MQLTAPVVARRSCANCIRYWHDDRGERFGEVLMRGGQPVPRPPASPTPCINCPKIPPGAAPYPASAVELTDANRQAYEHYRECKAVGVFPDDPLVRYTAGVIRDVEDAVTRHDANRTALNVLANVFKV